MASHAMPPMASDGLPQPLLQVRRRGALDLHRWHRTAGRRRQLSPRTQGDGAHGEGARRDGRRSTIRIGARLRPAYLRSALLQHEHWRLCGLAAATRAPDPRRARPRRPRGRHAHPIRLGAPRLDVGAGAGRRERTRRPRHERLGWCQVAATHALVGLGGGSRRGHEARHPDDRAIVGVLGGEWRGNDLLGELVRTRRSHPPVPAAMACS